MKRRVLVLSASVGAGHLRAGQAVARALELAHGGDVSARHVDVLELATPAFRRLYGKAYLDLVSRAPHLLGLAYDLMDRPVSERRLRDRLRLAVEKLSLRAFERLLADERPDLVVNTHFLPAEIISGLRRKGGRALPQATVTTDFEVHRLWVNEPCELYCTATDEGAVGLASWGVPAERIRVTGIPIDPVFAEPRSPAECRRRHDLPIDRPVVLQLAGGFGVGSIEETTRALLAVTAPLTLVVVAGRNEAARKRVGQLETPARHGLHALGFTDKIDELMGAADLIVTKPGGLTTSEALARGTALVVVEPIPGQETRNCDYLLEQGAALKANHPAILTHKVARLLAEPTRLRRLRQEAARLGRPRAAFDAAAEALGLLP